jgi:hypothetical protein
LGVLAFESTRKQRLAGTLEHNTAPNFSGIGHSFCVVSFFDISKFEFS